MPIINLPKQYIHTGVVMGPGPTDVHKRMKDAHHPEEIQKQAHADLTERVKEFNEREARGENPPLAPISYEVPPEVDKPVTTVTQTTSDLDLKTTQASASAAAEPISVQKPQSAK